MGAISKGQLQRLQVLYSQYARRTVGAGAEREERLAWASNLLERPIASFSDLTSDDATRLIDTLQGQLGIPATQAPARPKRKRLSSDAARKAGTEGRRGNASNEITLANDADYARIDYILNLLGWDRTRLDAWLQSSHSPLKKRGGMIRTLSDANRVWWALKGMAVRQGLWKERGKAA